MLIIFVKKVYRPSSHFCENTKNLLRSPVSHKALSSAALLRGRPDGAVVNTSALESRGRGFKSRSGQCLGQFLGFSLCFYIKLPVYKVPWLLKFSLCDGLFVSLTGLSSFVLIIYIC